MSCIPVAAVQRNARQKPLASVASPTMVEPSAEMLMAMLWSPVVSPRSCSPVAGVQRKAWEVAPKGPEPLRAAPTAMGALLCGGALRRRYFEVLRNTYSL
jgi:hypothetical protein